MSRRPRRLCRLAAAPAAVALALSVGVAPAVARTPDPASGLLLTVSDVPHAWTRGLHLTCPTVDGTHPHGAEACALLEQSYGDLDALAVPPHPCTREYHPVAAEVTGEWQGRQVSWQHTFSNPCMLDSATGPLFRF